MLYILIIAVLNLGLGFVAAVHLGRGYNRRMAVSSPRSEALDEPASESLNEAKSQPVDATLDDSDEEHIEPATEESVDAYSKGSSKKPPNKPGDEPTVDGEFAADLGSLFDDIEG